MHESFPPSLLSVMPCHNMNDVVTIIVCLLVLHLIHNEAYVLNKSFKFAKNIGPTLRRGSQTVRSAPLHDYQTIFKTRLDHFMKTGEVKMPLYDKSEDWALKTNYIDVAALEELLRQQDEEDGIQASAQPSMVNSSKSATTSQAEYQIEQRIKKAKESKSDAASSAVMFSSILHEMKDKGVWNTDLLTSVMLSIAKLEAPKEGKRGCGVPATGKVTLLQSSEPAAAQPTTSSLSSSVTSIQNSITTKQISALKIYIKAVDNRDIVADTAFLRKYILSLYLHNSPATKSCIELLLPLQLLDKDMLLPGEVCASIHAYGLHRTAESERAMQHQLTAYFTLIDAYSLQDTHLVLRTLSRYQLTPLIFTLLKYVRESRVVSSNVETIELLSQSLVRTVSKGHKAESMAELPKSDADYPEVVFAGRSNVGKSSLVNCLLNRKALASTSATPGHTRSFHFFTINQPVASTISTTSSASSASINTASTARISNAGLSTTNRKASSQSLPVKTVRLLRKGDRGDASASTGAPIQLKFVDVPGLGFAGNTSENTMTSWRGLLERYLHRRDALCVVCHLVDARHGVTDVDKEMLSLAARAAEARQQEQLNPFQYTIVLTKTDKIDPRELSRITEEVRVAVVDSINNGGTSGASGGSENSSFIARAKRAADRKKLLDGVSIIPTSSVSRAGAEQVWELIYNNIVPL